jgi:hypothetical protein
MITKDKLSKCQKEYEMRVTTSIRLEDGRIFTVARDEGKYRAECNDCDEFDFNTVAWKAGKFFECDFSEEEKQDIMNLYHNEDLEDLIEWKV